MQQKHQSGTNAINDSDTASKKRCNTDKKMTLYVKSLAKRKKESNVKKSLSPIAQHLPQDPEIIGRIVEEVLCEYRKSRTTAFSTANENYGVEKSIRTEVSGTNSYSSFMNKGLSYRTETHVPHHYCEQTVSDANWSARTDEKILDRKKPNSKRFSSSKNVYQVSMRHERIQMTLEDVNASNVYATALNDSKSGRKGVVTKKHRKLAEIQTIARLRQKRAENELYQTMDGIRRWIPFHARMQYSQQEFTLLQCRNTTKVVTLVLNKLRHRHIAEAFHRWNIFLLSMREEEQRAAALLLHGWTRCVLAKAELRRLQWGSKRSHLRTNMLNGIEMSKKIKSARIITSNLAKYVYRVRHHRHQRRSEAAQRLQGFIRKYRSQSGPKIIDLIKKKENEALPAICISINKASHKSPVLQQKLDRVDLRLKEKIDQCEGYRLGFLHVGAALRLQHIVRNLHSKKSHGRSLRHNDGIIREEKIVKLQALVRGSLARSHVRIYRLRAQNATEILQRAGHFWVARIRVLRIRNERKRDRDLRRQNWSNCTNKRGVRTKHRVPFHSILSYLSKSSHKFAVKIQARWRGYWTRKKIRRLRARNREMHRRKFIRKQKKAVIKIQKHVRGMQGRHQIWYTIMCNSAKCIQLRWRRFLGRKKIRAFRRIQCAIRRFRTRKMNRKSNDLARKTVISGRRIMKFMQCCAHKRAVQRHISVQQRLGEMHTLGHVQFKSLPHFVGDELLIHSFTCGLYDTSDLALSDSGRKNAHTPLMDREQLTTRLGFENEKFANSSAQRSLLDCVRWKSPVEADKIKSKYRWERKSYFGLWQQLFVFICGYEGTGVPKCEMSRAVNFLKALSKGFIDKETFPVQRVEAFFCEMCDRQTMTMDYNQFADFIKAVLKQRFADDDDEEKLFLRFMHEYVLPSPLEYGRYRKAFKAMIRERILWAHGVLRQFTNNVIRRKKLAELKKRISKQREAAMLQTKALMIQKWFRNRQFKAEMKAKWPAMFVHYVDQEKNSDRWRHIATGTELMSIPLVLHGQACRRVIPKPLRADEFHPMCTRHEGRKEIKNTIAAQVYCLQCEDVMCKACFRRDHATRIAFRHHQPKMLKLCCNCRDQIATRKCLGCANGKAPYCDTCFYFLHSAVNLAQKAPEQALDTKQKHDFRPYVIMCVECGERTGQWKCTVCDDLYCKRCLNASHSKAYRVDHTFFQVGYVAVIASQNLAKRKSQVEKRKLMYQKQVCEAHEATKCMERRRKVAATCIQAAIRSFLTRKRAKSYRRLIHRTAAAKKNRMSDERIRMSLIYKIRYTFGLAPLLRSDTQKERETQRKRLNRLYRMFLPRAYPRLQVESDPLGTLSTEQENRIRSTISTWCVYGEQVTILEGPWRGESGTIVSTRNLLSTGNIVVFISILNHCVVCDWAQVNPHRFDEELLRQPFTSALSRFLGLASESHQRLRQKAATHIRRTKLLYLQTVEYADIGQYAWVSVINYRERREEFWNVVTNNRSISQPASMEKLKRMEVWQRNMIELRVQVARARIEFLLDSTAKQEKYALKKRRNAVITDPLVLKELSTSLTSIEMERSSTQLVKLLSIEAEAIACARFWKQRVVENEMCGNVTRIKKFEELCVGNSILCWTLVRLWRHLDAQDTVEFETLATRFFNISPRFQLYIIQAMTNDLAQGYFTSARESFLILLKMEKETLQLLIDGAASAPAVK